MHSDFSLNTIRKEERTAVIIVIVIIVIVIVIVIVLSIRRESRNGTKQIRKKRHHL